MMQNENDVTLILSPELLGYIFELCDFDPVLGSVSRRWNQILDNFAVFCWNYYDICNWFNYERHVLKANNKGKYRNFSDAAFDIEGIFNIDQIHVEPFFDLIERRYRQHKKSIPSGHILKTILEFASVKGRVTLVEAILQDKTRDSFDLNEEQITLEAKRRCFKRRYLQLANKNKGGEPPDYAKSNEMLLFHFEAELILEISSMKVELEGVTCCALPNACRSGFPEIVEQLLNDPKKRFDPAVLANKAIRIACERGRTECVKLLLQDPRCDPGSMNNMALIWAATSGAYEVVKLLLADPRVNPLDQNCNALQWARNAGHSKIIKLLMDDPRVKNYLKAQPGH